MRRPALIRGRSAVPRKTGSSSVAPEALQEQGLGFGVPGGGEPARRDGWLVLAFLLGLGSACRSACGTGADPAAQAVPGSTPASESQLAAPVTLVRLDKSAYHTRLDLAADAVYLLTMDEAFRLVPGEAPRASKLELSDTGVATPTAFIFWSSGWFWLAPKAGGPPGRLAGVKERPMFIVSSGERFAWIGPDERGRHAVHALRQGRPEVLYAAPGPVVAASMVDDVVVFVERVGTDGWRLGSVPRTGGEAVFTAPRKGRYPAMLAAAKDVYHYHWDEKGASEVWAASPDLQSHRVVASHVTCSPLAASDSLFCASMDGLYEISPTRGLPKLVHPDGSSITAIAADRDRIVWVRDAGPEKLEVKLLRRHGAPPPRAEEGQRPR